MKIHYISILAAFAAALPSIQAETTTVVEDVLDGTPGVASDWNDGWERQGPWLGGIGTGISQFEESFSGLTPTAGSTYWSGYRGTTGTATQVGIKKNFGSTILAAGTYTITIDIGCGTGYDFIEPGISLIASDGTYHWQAKISDSAKTIVSNPTPSQGSWETWTITYTITPDTLTDAGDTVVGSQLGVLIMKNFGAGNGYAADNLKITYTAIPEASAMPLVLCIAGAMMVWRMRRRK